MKGLLIKDFKLMRAQKNFFLVIAAISLVIAIISQDNAFSIGFLGFIGSLFTLSTISYDEFDNGNAFLFALPVTRKSYVLEKYAFGIIAGIVSLLIGTVISVITVAVRDAGLLGAVLMTACTIFPAIILILSLMLPFQLKFGGEMGRIAIIAVIGIISVVGILLKKVIEFMGIDMNLLLNKIPRLGTQIYILLFVLVSFIALAISCKISVAIMGKKEF